MKKCDVCGKTTLLPEILGESKICKICFLKVHGPLWKYRKFENLKDAEKAKKKALELIKKMKYPEIIYNGTVDYFELQNSKMKKCDACGDIVLTTKSLGKSKVCKKCVVKIENTEWKKNDYETNEEVEKTRQKALLKAKKIIFH